MSRTLLVILVGVGILLLWVLLAFVAAYVLSKQGRRQPEEQRQEALPVDASNPPTWKVYQPRTGAPARSCACHPDRPLKPGQRVLWWPVPDSGGGVNVYCEDGVQV